MAKFVTFYSACKVVRKAIFDEYLADVDKDEKKEIIQKLKNTAHARLEILTMHPYTHKVVVS